MIWTFIVFQLVSTTSTNVLQSLTTSQSLVPTLQSINEPPLPWRDTGGRGKLCQSSLVVYVTIFAQEKSTSL